MVVWLLNHVLAGGDLALLESALEDVDVGVVLEIHIANLTNKSISISRGFGVLGFWGL